MNRVHNMKKNYLYPFHSGKKTSLLIYEYPIFIPLYGSYIITMREVLHGTGLFLLTITFSQPCLSSSINPNASCHRQPDSVTRELRDCHVVCKQ
jgi:hypothetical protein